MLCLGKIIEYPRSITSWKDKIEWFTQSREYHELDSIDGEPVVFEWIIFPGYTTVQLLQEIHRTMEEKRIQLEQFENPTMFMSMYNDIH